MNAAEQLVPVATESLSWTEICATYPDQFVCLVEISRVEHRSPEIRAARVVGHGPTHDAAFEPIRDHDVPYPRFAIRFTGSARHGGPAAYTSTIDALFREGEAGGGRRGSFRPRWPRGCWIWSSASRRSPRRAGPERRPSNGVALPSGQGAGLAAAGRLRGAAMAWAL